jgi:protein N-terminal glutamine amidohydrolase
MYIEFNAQINKGRKVINLLIITTIAIKTMNDKPLNQYTAFFCEENCWQFLKNLPAKERLQFKVLVLTNQAKKIALANQQRAPIQQFVVWDYHVILYNSHKNYIYDMDSRLAYPEKLEIYFHKTFGAQEEIPNEYRTQIRAIESNTYIQSFDSDRSHMLNQDGTYSQTLPQWPAIRSTQPITLQDTLDISLENNNLEAFVSPEEFLDRQL